MRRVQPGEKRGREEVCGVEGEAVRRGTRRRNHSPHPLHTYVDVAVALASGGGVRGWDGMGWDGMDGIGWVGQ